MSLQIISLIATISGTILLAFLYGYLYAQYKERFMGFWALSWLLFVLQLIFDLLMQVSPATHYLFIGRLIMAVSSGLFLLWGTYSFLGKSIARWLVYGAVVDCIWIVIGVLTHSSPALMDLPTFLFLGIIYIWTGLAFIYSPKIIGHGRHVNGWAFIFWGFYKMYYLLNNNSWHQTWNYLVAAFFEVLVALGIMIVYFQKNREDLSASEERFRKLAEETLRNNSLLQAQQESAIDGILVIDEHSKIISYNQRFKEIWKIPEEILSSGNDRETMDFILSNLIDPSTDRDYIKYLFENPTAKCRTELNLLDGRVIERYSGPIISPESYYYGRVWYFRDITESKQAENILKRYQILSEHTQEIILFILPDGQIIEANNAAVETYGYTKEELLAKKIFELRAPEEKEQIELQFAEAKSKGIRFEAIHHSKDGREFPVEVSAKGTEIGNEPYILGIIRDITERKQAAETINYLAYHDSLTDLPNRIAFNDRLELELAHAERDQHMLGVAFIDLDRFKIVNDTLGHAVGDQLLKDVSRRLVNCVRKSDTVARMGGDEFTLLLVDIKHEKDAATIAQKIIDKFKLPISLEDQLFEIKTSIGIALFPRDGVDAETLMRHADTAMYRAKEEGNNFQFYQPIMDKKNT